MDISKIIGIVLIAASLGIGYIGINKISDSTAQVKIIGIELDASNESKQMEGYIYLGAAILLFAGGVYTLKSKK